MNAQEPMWYVIGSEGAIFGSFPTRTEALKLAIEMLNKEPHFIGRIMLFGPADKAPLPSNVRDLESAFASGHKEGIKTAAAIIRTMAATYIRDPLPSDTTYNAAGFLLRVADKVEALIDYRPRAPNKES